MRYGRERTENKVAHSSKFYKHTPILSGGVVNNVNIRISRQTKTFTDGQ